MLDASWSYEAIALLFFVAAFLYASVGHGGASAYLALMAVFGVESSFARPAALLTNCTVALLSFSRYLSKTNFNLRLFLWLSLGSVPCAYIGASIPLHAVLYKQLLGAFLLLAAGRLLWPVKDADRRNEAPAIMAVAVGAAMGFASGMLGIGGGVLLSPTLIFLGWCSARESALISALFIFVNSISGLTALVPTLSIWQPHLPLVWMGAAVFGGAAGAQFGSTRFSSQNLKRVLALVLFVAAFKLLFP